jgi:hypothetical protein
MTTNLGPISKTLEADVREWVRKHGIVVWLDLDKHYSAFIDRLMLLRKQGELPYEVRAYRGSYLELLFALEPLESGTEKTPLVIHLPGFNEDSVRSPPPLLELYSAGVRYRKALDTLITEAAAGRVRPEQVAALREQGTVSLEAADAWLAALLESRTGGLAASLRAMSLPALVDDLLAAGEWRSIGPRRVSAVRHFGCEPIQRGYRLGN